MPPERARVAILISGRGSNMKALIDAARAPDCPYDVVLVASNNPDAEGLAYAGSQGIPTFARSHKGLSREAFDALIDRALRAAKAEWIALAGYMRLLSPAFVESWAGRIVNIHPSLLPAYKGLETHARVLAAGDARHGCTVHVVTPELDDGPILAQAEVPVRPGDTVDALADRVLEAEHRLYPAALAALIRDRRPSREIAVTDDKASKAAEAEAAAVRRRWITLGETVAVIAVLISALTLWNSYSERRSTEAARASEARSAGARARTLVLRGSVQEKGEELALYTATDQAIQSQTVTFPAALDLDPVETTEPRIEADWVEAALRRVRRAAGQPDGDAGDERLPVAITTRYVVDGRLTTDVSLYDVGYEVEERFLRGGAVKLRGLSLIGRTRPEEARDRLDRLWESRQPTISSGAKK